MSNLLSVIKLLLILLDVCCCYVYPNNVFNIGAIFDDFNNETELAFYDVLEEINANSNFYGFKLNPVVKHVPRNNPHEALLAMCTILEVKGGIVGVLGPTSKENADAVQAVCDTKEIPQLDVRPNKEIVRGTIVNFHPDPKIVSQVYVNIINTWEWKLFIILYEDNESFERIDEIIKMRDNKGYKVIVRQLNKNAERNYRPVLKELRKMKIFNMVIDCSTDTLNEVLLQAQQVGLITNEYNILITNLDFQTINLSPYKHGETNITLIRLVDNQNSINQHNSMNVENLRLVNMSVGAALTKDSVNMFANVLKKYKKISPKTLNCKSDVAWDVGQSIVNSIKVSNYSGLTGPITFDLEGKRSVFELDIFEVKDLEIERVAAYNIFGYLNLTRKYEEAEIEYGESVANRSFVVITCLTEPYGMLKESETQLYGNDRFEGFGIDLIHELSLMLGFNYTFIIRDDKNNGAIGVDGKWDGMIGDLLTHKADLAISDLTITSDREDAVDFTSPFMNLGISILYQKPKKAPPDFFSFADPFAFEVWLLLAGACLGVSLALFIMGRLCPEEWTNPYPCAQDSGILNNQFTLRNSFWFTIGCIMQQGTEIAPIAISTRMTAGVWWFFTLIMVSSYTANLAAFLTTESTDTPFSNIFELVERADRLGIKYGAKENGSTAGFFKASVSKTSTQDDTHLQETYKKIWHYMDTHKKDVLLKDNKFGVDKADRENYAFFMESTSIEYEVQRRCNLMQVGDRLDEKGYGIAMRKNSAYRNTLSTAVLLLSENGKIRELKRKWWEQRRGGGLCSGENENTEAKALNLKNVEGVFWVTIGGIALACVFVFFEMVLHVAKNCVKTGTSFKQSFLDELRFYFKFKGMTKPVRKDFSENGGEKTPSRERTVDRQFDDSNYGFLDGVHKR